MIRICEIAILPVIISGILFVHCNPELWLEGDDENGKPLFLTPYIEKGDIATARKLARVPLFDIFQIESYAGYFTVNKTYDSNQFLWYFPSLSRNSMDPVLLWLQGGPGESSLFGLFRENGPVKVRNNTFERRKVHWVQNYHVIYIDNPVGTGFSFTRHPEGYCTDQTQIGEQLYSTLTQFFKLFPELQQNKFFIAGESYAAKYVPALGHTIYRKNPTADTKINLKGLLIGNGWCDPEHQFMYSKYLYQIGLINLKERKIFEEYESRGLNYIKNKQWDEACNTFESLIMNGNRSYFYNVTGFHVHYHYLHTDAYNNDNSGEDFRPMMDNKAVRKAIHVGDLAFNDGTIVEMHLRQDFMKSVTPWMSEMLDNYYCCIYSGQLDIVVAYPLTLNYLQHLNFSGSEEYKNADRVIWRVADEIAGYMTRAGKLVEVLVRNAGHMVPTDQPEWALDMVKRFTDFVV